MSIGDKWAKTFGAMDKESSFKLLDAYFNSGGNFIDTANGYQDGSSEEFIGEWAEQRQIREQLVIATKYTTNYKRGENLAQKAQFVGNNVKSMVQSLDASLKKLRTHYVDILYLHWWDYETSIEEVVNGLHNLVVQGKVLYLGISDTPAWVVAKANTYARLTGKTPFVIYQGAWSVMLRDMEREVIPMARAEGMALAPWDVLGAGKIRTDEEEERRRETGENGRQGANWERTEEERRVCLALGEVARQVGAKSIQAVAIAYLLHKTPYVFPIIGGRKVEHLHANLESLEISLSPEQIAYLEGVKPFDKGFPVNRFGDGTEYFKIYNTAGTFDKWPVAGPIRPFTQQNSRAPL